MRRTVGGLTIAALGAMAILLGTTGAAGAKKLATPCTLGQLSPASLKLENQVFGQAQATFERQLTGASAQQRAAAGRRFQTELAAYVYGFPIVMVRRTIATFPANVLVAIGSLATPAVRAVVAPNDDTLYSVAQIDLSSGPIVIQAPPTGGRYSVLQLLDGYTDVDAYIGAGSTGPTGETALIVPPGWQGSAPAGMHVVRAATQQLWLIGRTLVNGPSDDAAADALLKRYSLTSLTAFEAGTRSAPLVLPTVPARQPVKPPKGAAFFDELGTDLASNPTPAADACALRMFATVGIGPGLTPSTQLHGLTAATLTAAAAAAPHALASVTERAGREPGHTIGGWTTTPPDTGHFGTDYLDRAAVATFGLGANTRRSALYLMQGRDSAGRALNGRRSYTLHFAAGQLPPVRAFWSVTLYDRSLELFANPLDRYSLGDRSTGLRHDADGGLTIVVSHTPPPASERSNWIPAPAGPFSLYLRLYEPKPAAVDGGWMPPPVVRATTGDTARHDVRRPTVSPGV